MKDFRPFQYEDTIKVIDRTEDYLNEIRNNFEELSANMTHPDWFDRELWHNHYKSRIDYCQAWIDKIRRLTNETRDDDSISEDHKDEEYHDLREAAEKITGSVRFPESGLGLWWDGGEVDFDRVRNYLINYDFRCGDY